MQSRSGRKVDLGFEDVPGAESPVAAVREATGQDEPGGASMSAGYQRIVNTIFTIDEERVFDELTRKLSFGKPGSRMEYADLADAIEEGSSLAWKASQLHTNAKAALEGYLSEVEVLRADMRDKARADLEAGKAGKEKGESKGKAITEADITARMAGMFPDEYRTTEARKVRAEGAVKHLANLMDRWAERVKVLDAMIRTSRKT